MFIDGSKTKEILGFSLVIAFYLAVPCLALLSYRGWAKQWRTKLPLWRNLLGAGSIAFTLINWLAFAYVAFAIVTRRRTDFFMDIWTIVSVLVSLAAVVLSLALKGRPRICAFLAACLMATPLIMDYVRGT
jgi:hypothetical protein